MVLAMRRRSFLAGAVGLALSPRDGHAQAAGHIPRVGYLFSFAARQGQHLWEACRQGIRDAGYVDGRTILLEPRWAGTHDALPGLVAELLQKKVDVLVAAATPASQAARAATKTIPIVMVAVADPIRAGLISTFSRPGGNVTGLVLLTPELSGKRVELLVELLRAVPRLAVLRNPANRSHDVFSEETLEAARTINTEVLTVDARGADELEPAFDAAVRGRVTALIVFDDPVIWSHRAQIVALAARRKLPVMYGYPEYVEEGGLISYGPHRPDLYRRTSFYVDRILKGADPATLPVERPIRFELLVNVKTAAALGLTVGPSLLARADSIVR
jgi:putative ABC transport system substrate-binding protein